MAEQKLKKWNPDSGLNEARPRRWTPDQNDDSYNEDDIYNEPEKKQKTGIGSDITNSLMDMPSYGLNALSKLPHEIDSAVHMPLGRSLRNIGQGLEDTAELPINLGSHLADYLKEKDIPYLRRIAEVYPHIPKHDFFGLGEPQAGDALWQMATPGGALGKATKALKGLKGLGTRAAYTGAYAASQGENPIQAALLGSALETAFKGAAKVPKLYGHGKGAYSDFKNSFNTKEIEPKVNSYKERLMQAQEKEKLATEESEYAKNKLKISENKASNRALSTNPEKLRGDITKEERSIKKGQQAAIESKNKPEPIEPELLPAHEYEPKSIKTADYLKTAEQKSQKAESQFKEYVGQGEVPQVHHERFAIEAKKDIDKIEQSNKENYSKIDEPLEKNNVTIKQPKEAKEVADYVSKVLSEHDIWSENVSKLPDEVEELNRHEVIPAKKYMQIYRSTRDATLDAYHQMKELGGSSTEAGEKAYNRWKKLQDLQGKMYSHLKSSLPKKDFDALEKAQAYFRDVVAPIRQSKLGRQIKYNGKVGKNILEDIIGTDIGQEQFRTLIDENPELQRLIIGQQKFEHINKPNEALKRYIDKSPEIQKLKHEYIKHTKEHEHAKQKHEEAKFYDIENQKASFERKKERDNLIRQHEKEKSDHAKNQQEEQNKIKNSINESTRKINTYRKQIDVLRKRSAHSESKLKEKISIGNEVKNLQKSLKDAENELDKRQKKLKNLIKFAAGAVIGKQYLHW